MLAHIREKMHHTEEVTDGTECDLGEAELEFTRAREDLGAVKVFLVLNVAIVNEVHCFRGKWENFTPELNMPLFGIIAIFFPFWK